MGWSSGLSSRVSCFYNHIIENNSKTVISRLFMDSKIMLYALQEVCRTTLVERLITLHLKDHLGVETFQLVQDI